MIQTRPLCWGAKVTQPFRDRLYRLCAELDWSEQHASWLMACMAFETGRTFSPSIRNPASSATGLIQFMASTAQGLGTTTQALSKMSAVEQLSWVQRYFAPYASRIKSLDDMYLAILWPVAIGKPAEYVLWRKGMKAYWANRGLDINKDNRVTKREAADKVYRLYEEGMRPGNVMPRQAGGFV
jgi:hypothetical protein